FLYRTLACLLPCIHVRSKREARGFKLALGNISFIVSNSHRASFTILRCSSLSNSFPALLSSSLPNRFVRGLLLSHLHFSFCFHTPFSLGNNLLSFVLSSDLFTLALCFHLSLNSAFGYV